MHNIFKTLVAVSCTAAIFPAAASTPLPSGGGETPAEKAWLEKCTVYAHGTKSVPPVPCKSIKTDLSHKMGSSLDKPPAAPAAASVGKAAPLSLSNNGSR